MYLLTCCNALVFCKIVMLRYINYKLSLPSAWRIQDLPIVFRRSPTWSVRRRPTLSIPVVVGSSQDWPPLRHFSLIIFAIRNTPNLSSIFIYRNFIVKEKVKYFQIFVGIFVVFGGIVIDGDISIACVTWYSVMHANVMQAPAHCKWQLPACFFCLEPILWFIVGSTLLENDIRLTSYGGHDLVVIIFGWDYVGSRTHWRYHWMVYVMLQKIRQRQLDTL